MHLERRYNINYFVLLLVVVVALAVAVSVAVVGWFVCAVVGTLEVTLVVEPEAFHRLGALEDEQSLH